MSVVQFGCTGAVVECSSITVCVTMFNYYRLIQFVVQILVLQTSFVFVGMLDITFVTLVLQVESVFVL